jgi:hypothetical protein
MKALSPARLPRQPCERCGGLGVDAAPDGPTLVLACPGCGHEEARRRLPFFSITGPSGAGLALVCDEAELLVRLAARVRAVDNQAPADFLEQTCTFNRVLRERLEHVDTSALDPDEAADRVASWIRERL